MKHVLVFLALTLIAITAHAQVPTEVQGHLMGETMDDYVQKTTGVSHLSEFCVSPAGLQARKNDYKTAENCARALSDDEIMTTGISLSKLIFSALRESHESYVTETRFWFKGGRLVTVWMTFRSRVPVPELILRHMKEKYGEPATVGTLRWQNNFGASWETLTADWKERPDKTRISLQEMSGSEFLGSTLYSTVVTFTIVESKKIENKNPF
jgi:hypothetical protein